MSINLRADRGNLLLAGMPRAQRKRLIDRAERVALLSTAVLCTPGAEILHVYFPIDCLVSLLTLGAVHARWLLMMSDRMRSTFFHVTHELLATLLGVRRVGVTGANTPVSAGAVGGFSLVCA